MSDTNQFPTLLLNVIEFSLNRYLGMDPDALERIGRLAGKVIAIELRGLGVSFYLIPHLSGVKVARLSDTGPDTLMSGTPGAFLRLGMTSNPVTVLFSGDVEISGDVELGQRFKKILDGMEIDWEEQISKAVGDVLAHQIGSFARDARQWVESSGTALGLDIEEYLHEELRLAPQDFEINEFLSGVDKVRSDTDRLEQRIGRLGRRLKEDSS